ncbi:hypothetical protein Ddc_01358 [Ditylenchus destructor]|nr:hypothetical protein Ddc_01358 [Ditylenchus destructor]
MSDVVGANLSESAEKSPETHRDCTKEHLDGRKSCASGDTDEISPNQSAVRDNDESLNTLLVMREEDLSVLPVHASTPLLDELTHTMGTIQIDNTQTSPHVTENSGVSKWFTPKPFATNITRHYEEQSSGGCSKNTKQVRGIYAIPALQRGVNVTRFYEEQLSHDLSLNHTNEIRPILHERKKPGQNRRSLSATARYSGKECVTQTSVPLTQTSSSNQLFANLDKQFMDLLLSLIALFRLATAADQIEFYVVCNNEILEKPYMVPIVEPNQPKDLIKEKKELGGGLQMIKSDQARPLYTIEVACPDSKNDATKRQKHWIQTRDQSQIKSKKPGSECLYLLGNKNTKRYAPCPPAPAGPNKAGRNRGVNFDVIWMTKSVFSGYVLCDAPSAKKSLELDDGNLKNGKLTLKDDGKFEISFKKRLDENDVVKVKAGCASDGRNTNQQYELSWNSFMNEHLLFNEVLLLNGSKKKIEYIDKRDVAEKGFNQ